MKTMTRIVVGAAVALFVAGCSKDSAEGKYVLDKPTMKAELEKKVQELPEKERGMAKFAMAMMEAMEMEVDLQKEGKLKVTTSMPSLKEGADKKVKNQDGTWKLEEKKLILSVPGEKDLNCELQGKNIKCSDKEMSLVFVRA